MNESRPILVVTGASGFIGRNVVLAAGETFSLYCLARRSQQEAGIPSDRAIKWIQADIGDQAQVSEVADYIAEQGGADFVLHLAGYYDFSQLDNPAYERTNVSGTENILRLAERVGAKRFIFSSSLAACEFTPPGCVVTETTPTSARFPYAVSKHRAEAIIHSSSGRIPAAVARLAAVFSDWCEYPPLYVLLETWLSRSFQSRILAGKGAFAIPYIHIRDVISGFWRIMELHADLPRYGVFNLSPRGSTSHRELFATATRYYFMREHRPWFVPRAAAWAGLHMKWCLWRVQGKEPFERPWMAKYIDAQLNVEATHTYHTLQWSPTPRLHILRRLLFLSENKRTLPVNWRFRNESLLQQRVALRRSIQLYRELMEIRGEIVEEVLHRIRHPENAPAFPNYRLMDPATLRWYINLVYQLVAVSIRNRDRSIISDYLQIICAHRFAKGYSKQEVIHFILVLRESLSGRLYQRAALHDFQQRIYLYVTLTLQYTMDEIEDSFEALQRRPPRHGMHEDQDAFPATNEELQNLVERLEHICGDPIHFQ
jgi:nucleoside-diphosphate-sugar epimerase